MNPTQALLLVLSCLFFCACADGGSGPFGGGSGSPGNGGNGELGGDEPGLLITDEPGPDGCPIAQLDPSAWAPLHASYEGGNDPFFHLHTNEPTLFFGAEMYTDYGAGWTGELGTFAPGCGANGICVYLVPDGETVLSAVAGEVDVIALSQVGGALERPAELRFRDMTFTAEGTCLHVQEVTLRAP